MNLFVTALEPSSNTHLTSLLAHLPDTRLLGVFDPALGTPLYAPKAFSVMGFADVLPKLLFFRRAQKALIEAAEEADKILLMDSSSFNLPLAKALKNRYPDKEIIYYILPQVWAWKKWRAKTLDAHCDTLAAILPFETAYYDHATYVGHPLLDQITLFRESGSVHENAADEAPIAYLPGSRKSEIRKLMPLFRDVRAHLGKKACLVVPPFYSDAEIPDVYGDTEGFILRRDTHAALREAEFAFICSGTATLEAALIGAPFILTYIAKPIDYFIARTLVGVRYIGLANIFMERMGAAPLHPELIQQDVTLDNLLKAYETFDAGAFHQSAATLRNYLAHGSAKNVAEHIKTPASQGKPAS